MNRQSTALWYYEYFTSLKSKENATIKEAEADAVWEEYETTEEEELAIQQELLSSLERCRIQEDTRSQQKFEANDSAAWDEFYNTHTVNFFKDRHYLATAFPTEFGDQQPSRDDPCLVELGCGVGNALLPLLEDDQQTRSWTVYGMDLSQVAVSLLRQDERFIRAAKVGRAFCASGDLCSGVPTNFQGQSTVTSLLFCLSAIHPDHQPEAVRHAASTLGPGGVLVFRDYGRFDQAQIKLGLQRNKLVADNFYRKHDGTKCYYFTLEELQKLFRNAGMEVIELEYIKRVYKNRAENSTRRRVWVHGRFRKLT